MQKLREPCKASLLPDYSFFCELFSAVFLISHSHTRPCRSTVFLHLVLQKMLLVQILCCYLQPCHEQHFLHHMNSNTLLRPATAYCKELTGFLLCFPSKTEAPASSLQTSLTNQPRLIFVDDHKHLQPLVSQLSCNNPHDISGRQSKVIIPGKPAAKSLNRPWTRRCL